MHIPDNISKEEKVIVIEGLYKSFGENHVLRGVDLHLYRRENVVVLGRSGTGKSVLIILDEVDSCPGVAEHPVAILRRVHVVSSKRLGRSERTALATGSRNKVAIAEK